MNDAHSPSPAAAGASPLSALQSLLGALKPPEWVVDEVQNRVVLFLNHVLGQEPQAQDRLRRHKGKPVRLQWGAVHLTLAATAAGLVERLPAATAAELTVTLTQTSPLGLARELAQSLASGHKPGVDIQGDVQLAAEVAWLVDNVRWDVEEDLSQFVGDAAAHTLVGIASTVARGLKAFVARVPGRSGGASPAAPGGTGTDGPAA